MKKRKKLFIIIFIAGLAAIIGFLALGKGDKVEYVTAKVEKGELIQTVSEIGTVKSPKELRLNFSQSGKIAEVYVEVGDQVEEGDSLIELDSIALQIRKKEAEASLAIAQADLNRLLAGAAQSDLNVSQVGVDQAKASYLASLEELEKIKKLTEENVSQAEKNLNDLLSDSPATLTAYEQAVKVAETSLGNTKTTYAQSVDNYKNLAIVGIEDKIAKARSALNTIDTILNDTDTKDVFSAKKRESLNLVNLTYVEAEALLSPAENSLRIAKSGRSEAEIYQAGDDCLRLLDAVFKSLGYCYDALINSITSPSFTQTQLNTYKTNVNADQVTINTGISAVKTAIQNLRDAILAYENNVSSSEQNLINAQAGLNDAITKAEQILASAKVNADQQIVSAQSRVDNALEAWNLAKSQLEKTASPARFQDVALYQARVRQAEAGIEMIQQQIEESIIKAPISGVITKVNYKVGEQISAGSSVPVVSMLSEIDFEVELDISEVDIKKIKIGDSVEIDFDAFGSDIKFSGYVHFFEPAATIIQDVVYYKATLKFNEEERENNLYFQKIKPGMTINAIIITDQKQKVLFVPGRAILERNGERYIRILEDDNLVEKKVSIGLRGDGGFVEILSGVKEGEEVVIQIREK